MALTYAGITAKPSIPRVLSRKYEYKYFTKPFQLKLTSGIVNINVEEEVAPAWQIVQHRAAQKACNQYFATLSRKRTLRQVLDEGDITLYSLEPKGNHTSNDLPAANSAERNIAIHPMLLLAHDPNGLACTLIHELAHIAGASTNPDKSDPHSLDAEKALPPCGCQFDKQNVGWRIRSSQIRTV